MIYQAPPPRPVFTIESDRITPHPGVFIYAKCSKGYPPYAYIWMPYGDPNYYDKLMIFLQQPCFVKGGHRDLSK